MEIKNLNNNRINAYKSVANTRTVKDEGKKSGRVGGENVDKLEFDYSSSFEAAKANAALDIGKDASAARIEQLQASYAGDNCPVNSDAIADAIINS